MTDPTIRHVSELRRLKGVLAVRDCDPEPGCVTLVVSPGHEGLREWLDPGHGDGTGRVPVGLRVLVKVPGYTTRRPR